ncbi:MAG: PAS domain S-box protein [Desulfobacterales bacterium]
MEENPLYNTRIIKSFVEYISKYHPQVDMTPILDYAGITTYKLEDVGHWLTQTQVDRFYEFLVKTVGDPDLARKVGQSATISKAGGVLSQYTLGFMTPSGAYTFLGKLYPHASRGSSIETRILGPNRVEVVAVQNPGVTEKPYQCENRLGTFEGIAKLFTNELARIEHTTCMHISGDRCIYDITWKTTPSFIWKRIANYSYLMVFIISLFLFFALPPNYSVTVILSMILAPMGITLYQFHLEKNELATTFKNHCDTASRLLDEISAKNNNSILIQKIGQTASNIFDIDNLLPLIMKLIEKHLDFDHGMIMLLDSGKTRLISKAGFGYHPDMMKKPGKTILRIDKPESKNAVIKTFREQKPCLVDYINIFEGNFSEKITKSPNLTVPNLYMCVPIVFEEKSLGILIVDNNDSKKVLLESDLNLMMGIASQIALCITNVTYFQKVLESEELFKDSMNRAPDGVYIIDLEGKFLYSNYKAEKIIGYSGKELLGRNALDLNILAQSSLKRAGELLEANIRGKSTGPDVLEVIRKDGRHIMVEISTTIVQQSGKKVVLEFIRDISERLKAEKQLKESRELLRSLVGRFEKVREEERIIISREIHDVMGGGLTGLQMDLFWLMHKIENAGPDKEKAAVISRIFLSSKTVENMIKVTRRISTDLRPPVLDDLGVIAAIEWQLSEFTRQSDIPHRFTTAFEYIPMDNGKAIALFRIFQETLTNIMRHSGATEIVVVLRGDGSNPSGNENLVLEIMDNGRGITEEEIIDSKSLGLLGMKERALTFSGEFSISGEPGAGTTVLIRIPSEKRGNHDKSYHS